MLVFNLTCVISHYRLAEFMIMVTLSRSPAMAAQLVKENVFIKSKSSNGRIMILRPGGGKLENPSHMNLRGVRPTLVFALGSDPLSSSSLTTWGDYWCPIFLPYLKLFLEKILRSVYQGNTFDCWFSAARWRGALQSRSWLPIRKTLKAFLLGRHLCGVSFNENNWKNIDLLLHLRSIDISLQEILHHLQVACT